MPVPAASATRLRSVAVMPSRSAPKNGRQALPKKARQAARNNAILSKIKDSQLKVVEDLKLEQPKTKLFATALKNLKIDRTVLVAINGADASVERAARNLAKAKLTTVAQLNAWDILNTRTLLVTKDGLEALLK